MWQETVDGEKDRDGRVTNNADESQDENETALNSRASVTENTLLASTLILCKIIKQQLTRQR